CDYLRSHNRAISGPYFRHEMAAIRCADDCPPQGHDPISAFAIENNVIAGREKPFKSVPETDDVPSKLFSDEHDSSQDGIEARAIATAGQNTNTRLHFRNFKERRSPVRRSARQERPSERSSSPKQNQSIFFGSARRPAAAHWSYSCHPRCKSAVPSPNRFVLPRSTTIK